MLFHVLAQNNVTTEYDIFNFIIIYNKYRIGNQLCAQTNLAPDTLANYRPLSNLPFLSKVLERPPDVRGGARDHPMLLAGLI